VVQLGAEDNTEVGWLTVAAIIVLDFTTLLCVYGKKTHFTGPIKTTLFMTWCRAVIVGFGDRYIASLPFATRQLINLMLRMPVVIGS
jgi:hypothetical protein